MTEFILSQLTVEQKGGQANYSRSTGYNSTFKKLTVQCPPASNGYVRVGLNDPDMYWDVLLIKCSTDRQFSASIPIGIRKPTSLKPNRYV
ncbi:MAG: hypothetical protein IPL74_13200 [Bacteroidetes bacterium]|nr:hypothetical protein [Bacteroidota bacterium]